MEGPGFRIVAVTHIHAGLGFTHYRPGDFIPFGAPDAPAWIKSGAARIVPADYKPQVYARAVPLTSRAGRPAVYPDGNPAGIGRVPDRHEGGRNPCSR